MRVFSFNLTQGSKLIASFLVGGAALSLIFAMPAAADPLGSATSALPNVSTPSLNLGTTVQGLGNSLPGSNVLSGGLTTNGPTLSSGQVTTGTLFLPDDGYQAAFRDPNSPTHLPVKAGMALFSTDAGKFRIDFQYAGRFNGDFEEHQAGFKIRMKLPGF